MTEIRHLWSGGVSSVCGNSFNPDSHRIQRFEPPQARGMTRKKICRTSRDRLPRTLEDSGQHEHYDNEGQNCTKENIDNIGSDSSGFGFLCCFAYSRPEWEREYRVGTCGIEARVKNILQDCPYSVAVKKTGELRTRRLQLRGLRSIFFDGQLMS